MAEIIRIIRQLATPELDYGNFMVSLHKLLRFCSDCAANGGAADTETLDLIRTEIRSCAETAEHDKEGSMSDYFGERALSKLLEEMDPDVSKKELEDVLGERVMNLVDHRELSESREVRSVEDLKTIILAQHISDMEKLLKPGDNTVFGEIGKLVLDMLKRKMEAGQAETDFLNEDIQNRETVLAWWTAKESR